MKAEPIKLTSTIDARAVRVPGRAPAWVVPLVKLCLIGGDMVLAIASFVAAFYLRHYHPVFPTAATGFFKWSRAFAPYAVLLPLVIPIRLLLLRYYDLYRVRGEFSFVDDIARVFKATAIASLLIVAAAFMYRGGVAYRTFSYSREVFILDFVIAFASVAVLRTIVRA